MTGKPVATIFFPIRRTATLLIGQYCQHLHMIKIGILPFVDHLNITNQHRRVIVAFKLHRCLMHRIVDSRAAGCFDTPANDWRTALHADLLAGHGNAILIAAPLTITAAACSQQSDQ